MRHLSNLYTIELFKETSMNSYVYKGFLVEIWEKDDVWTSLIHVDKDKTILATDKAQSQEEAETTAEETIESWN
jgi:hypothetical protein